MGERTCAVELKQILASLFDAAATTRFLAGWARMDNLAIWVAPIATTLAALMTASNLGSRITGYGFIVFTIGSPQPA